MLPVGRRSIVYGVGVREGDGVFVEVGVGVTVFVGVGEGVGEGVGVGSKMFKGSITEADPPRSLRTVKRSTTRPFSKP